MNALLDKYKPYFIGFRSSSKLFIKILSTGIVTFGLLSLRIQMLNSQNETLSGFNNLDTLGTTLNRPINSIYLVIFVVTIYSYVNYLITSRSNKVPIKFNDALWFVVPCSLLVYGSLFAIRF
jgi:hypothetical protein